MLDGLLFLLVTQIIKEHGTILTNVCQSGAVMLGVSP